LPAASDFVGQTIEISVAIDIMNQLDHDIIHTLTVSGTITIVNTYSDDTDCGDDYYWDDST
jgi:hypothetical protein